MDTDKHRWEQESREAAKWDKGDANCMDYHELSSQKFHTKVAKVAK